VTCGSGLDVPDMFPSIESSVDASLSSTGFSGASSPASTVLPKCYDFLPPISPRFVFFAWRYPLCSLSSGRVRRLGLELVTRCSVREIVEETAGSPKFLENLGCPFADSCGTAYVRPLRRSSAVPGMQTAEAPTTDLSKLNSMAS
jgi:hypothetical protein